MDIKQSLTYRSDELKQFEFVGNRPLQITIEEREIFWKLIQYGFDNLNNQEDEEEA